MEFHSSKNLLHRTTLIQSDHLHGLPDCSSDYRVCRLSVFRSPQFYGQLPGCARSQGGQLKRYKDSFRINLKSCDISASSWESLAENRSKWRQLCHQQTVLFNDNRLDELKRRQQQRKDGDSSTSTSDDAGHICDVYGCNCSSCIGLFSHKSKRHR